MQKKLVLMGPPGSGKGTIAEILIEKFNLPHISTGNILRNAVSKGDEFGKQLQKMMDAGDLISDEIVDEILKKRITEDNELGAFILDGYPRHIGQAEKLIKLVDLDEIVVVNISDENIIKRLAGRRTCPKCGATYHIEYIPPKVEGICDICGTKLIRRADEEKIKHRLALYHKETEPVIDFFRQKGIKIKNVPGEFDPEKDRDMIANLVAD